MRNVSDKSCRENQNIFCIPELVFENSAVFEITWKNIAERGRPSMTIWRTTIARCIHKAKNTHTEYVIRIAFPS